MKLKLAFSGGGFRATFYALGAYRRLVEMGVHQAVTHLSSVSGGSLTAGAILYGLAEGDFADVCDFDRRVTGPLRRLGQINLRRRLLVSALMPRFRQGKLESLKKRLSRMLQESLDRELFHGKLLLDLPLAPEWSCNATCLNTMNRFRFKPSDIYGNSLGLSTDIHDITVSLAVAASNAFPLLFAPIALRNNGRIYRDPLRGDHVSTPETIYLTDGGVFDNTGTDTILKEAAPYIVLDASQATKNSLAAYRPRGWGLNLFLQEIALNQIAELRRRLLVHHARGVQLLISRPLRELIEAEQAWAGEERMLPVYPERTDRWEALIAGIRTDLDAFHDIEIDTLMWAGATRMDVAIKLLKPELVAEEHWRHLPEFPAHPTCRIEQILMRGQKNRVFSPHKKLS